MAKKLTVDEVEEMRMKVIENARELIEDAKLLLENKRYARAYTLSHLMCEELFKIPMIGRALTESTLDKNYDWKVLHKRLVNHKPKLRGFMIMQTVDIKRLEKVVGISMDKGHEAFEKKLNILKNDSLYSGFQEGDFKKPSEVITKEIAESMYEIAYDYFKYMEESVNLLKGTSQHLVNENFARFFANIKDKGLQNPDFAILFTHILKEFGDIQMKKHKNK